MKVFKKSIAVTILAREIGQEEEINVIQIGKKDVKGSPFANDKGLYLRVPTDSGRRGIVLRKTSSTGYKIKKTF